MTNTLNVSTPNDRQVVMTRIFNAPRKLVWDTMAKPELLRRWLFGPPGWTMTVCEDDGRVGGSFRWAWKGPGGELTMTGDYREYAPPERVVRTEKFAMPGAPPMGEQLATLVLTEQGSQTRLTITLSYASKEARDGALASGMDRGMNAGYARLDELLARTHRPGEFCWINILTSRSAEARDFFAKLLGWTYTEIPGVGHRIQVGGSDMGGIFDLDSPQTPPGTPPYIGVMVKVESADAIAEKVTALGGKAKPAFDVMDAGRMAVCFDPNGAEFDVWQPKQLPGTIADRRQHGATCWFETLTTDVPKAKKFYTDLFGWTPHEMPKDGWNYTVFNLGSAPVGGMMPILPHMGKMPPHWATYFAADDVDATASKAAELGAKVCVPAQDIPGVGRFAGITSPQGVTFYVAKFVQA